MRRGSRSAQRYLLRAMAEALGVPFLTPGAEPLPCPGCDDKGAA
jgi:hypothetical protein